MFTNEWALHPVPSKEIATPKTCLQLGAPTCYATVASCPPPLDVLRAASRVQSCGAQRAISKVAQSAAATSHTPLEGTSQRIGSQSKRYQSAGPAARSIYHPLRVLSWHQDLTPNCVSTGLLRTRPFAAPAASGAIITNSNATNIPRLLLIMLAYLRVFE